MIFQKYFVKKLDYDKWTISDVNRGARSQAESKTSQNSFGYIHEPVTNIPFSKCCIDLLHLLLRITEKLENLLFKQLAELGKLIKNRLMISRLDKLLMIVTLKR